MWRKGRCSGKTSAEGDFEIVGCDAVWVVWRRAEGDGEVTKCYIEEFLLTCEIGRGG